MVAPAAAPQPHSHCRPQSHSCSCGWCYCSRSSSPALIGPVCAGWPCWPSHSSSPAQWPLIPLIHAGWPSLATICVGWTCQLLFSPPPFACIHTRSCQPALVCVSFPSAHLPLLVCVHSCICTCSFPLICARSVAAHPCLAFICAHLGFFRLPSLSSVSVSNT